MSKRVSIKKIYANVFGFFCVVLLVPNLASAPGELKLGPHEENFSLGNSGDQAGSLAQRMTLVCIGSGGRKIDLPATLPQMP